MIFTERQSVYWEVSRALNCPNHTKAKVVVLYRFTSPRMFVVTAQMDEIEVARPHASHYIAFKKSLTAFVAAFWRCSFGRCAVISEAMSAPRTSRSIGALTFHSHHLAHHPFQLFDLLCFASDANVFLVHIEAVRHTHFQAHEFSLHIPLFE